MKTFKIAALAAAALLVSASASASTSVTVTSYTLTPTNTTGNALYSVDLTTTGNWLSGGMYGVSPFEIGIKTTDGGSFAAYCIDLYTDLATPPITYTMTEAASALYGKLFAAVGFNGMLSGSDQIDLGIEKAALQLAVWEIAYDGASYDGTTGTTLSLGTGKFKAKNAYINNAGVYSADPSVLTLANGYLSQAMNYTGQYQNVQFLTSVGATKSQTLVTSVPEPSTYALMAACLGVVGLVSRRKSA